MDVAETREFAGWKGANMDKSSCPTLWYSDATMEGVLPSAGASTVYGIHGVRRPQ